MEDEFLPIDRCRQLLPGVLFCGSGPRSRANDSGIRRCPADAGTPDGKDEPGQERGRDGPWMLREAVEEAAGEKHGSSWER